MQTQVSDQRYELCGYFEIQNLQRRIAALDAGGWSLFCFSSKYGDIYVRRKSERELVANSLYYRTRWRSVESSLDKHKLRGFNLGHPRYSKYILGAFRHSKSLVVLGKGTAKFVKYIARH